MHCMESWSGSRQLLADNWREAVAAAAVRRHHGPGTISSPTTTQPGTIRASKQAGRQQLIATGHQAGRQAGRPVGQPVPTIACQHSSG